MSHMRLLLLYISFYAYVYNYFSFIAFNLFATTYFYFLLIFIPIFVPIIYLLGAL